MAREKRLIIESVIIYSRSYNVPELVMPARLSSWILGLIALLLVGPTHPASAQSMAHSTAAWNVGTTIQAVAMEGVPFGTGIGVFASWHRKASWGVQIELRRDAVVQRNLRKAYRSSSDWADQRRFSITPAVVWRPTAPQGQFSQSFELTLGPTLQVQRGEDVRRIGAVDGGRTVNRIVNDPGLDAENTYLDRSRSTALLLLTDDTNRTNLGATVGLQYGVTYKAVTVRGVLMGRKVTNIDGVTFGFGGSVSVSL